MKEYLRYQASYEDWAMARDLVYGSRQGAQVMDKTLLKDLDDLKARAPDTEMASIVGRAIQEIQALRYIAAVAGAIGHAPSFAELRGRVRTTADICGNS